MGTRGVRCEAWDSTHPRWADLLALIAELGQTDWVAFSADFDESAHILVAHDAKRIAGFLGYVA